MSGPATGASGGESYRDPFAPDFWTKQVEAPAETEANRQTAMAESQMTEILKSEDAAAETKVAEQRPRPPRPSRQGEGSAARAKPAEIGSRGCRRRPSRTQRPEAKPLGELFRRQAAKAEAAKPEAAQAPKRQSLSRKT